MINRHEGFQVSLSAMAPGDWKLNRKKNVDQERHNEKIRDAIKDQLPGIVGEEALITGPKDRMVRVPVKSLQLPKFRYDYGRNKHIGQGDGNDQSAQSGSSRSDRAGTGEGDEVMDWVLISADELLRLAFADFRLPNMEERKRDEITHDTEVYDQVRRSGPLSNLDKRRTIRANLLRNAMEGKAKFGGLQNRDLRFRVSTPVPEPKSNAVIIAIRDVSGSMGEFEKYVTRTMMAWKLGFLRRKYPNVEVAFIAHTQKAQVVDEETFFQRAESGGTKISPAYELGLQIAKDQYPPADWNVYPYHYSDGDNAGDADNMACVDLVKKMLAIGVNSFGYVDIRSREKQPSELMRQFQESIRDPRFVAARVGKKEDMFGALKAFFSIPTEGAVSRV